MKLEDQVASLELCKRLKELGVMLMENSLFFWVQWSGKDWSLTSREMLSFSENKEVLERVMAFNVAELGSICPPDTISWKGTESDFWYCIYQDEKDGIFRDLTEANARAKMLIHLIEKGIVRP